MKTYTQPLIIGTLEKPACRNHTNLTIEVEAYRKQIHIIDKGQHSVAEEIDDPTGMVNVTCNNCGRTWRVNVAKRSPYMQRWMKAALKTAGVID